VHVRSALRLALAAGSLLSSACTVDTGVVEVAWAFVDRDGEQIFPGGLFDPAESDACNLPGRFGETRVTYDLDVALEICDPACDAGCDDPACQVMSPLTFDCRTSRGSDPDVPSSDDPYRFTFRANVAIDGREEACRPAPTCVAVPGPRERTVRPGLVTDLQVYQVVVDFDLGASVTGRGALDLGACGCG
jgi:hypothetical protein